MRAKHIITIACLFGVTAPTAHADALLDDFKTRIEAALAIEGEDRRSAAVGALFYRGGLNAWAKGLVERTIKRVVKLRNHKVSFAPLKPNAKLMYVVNGYEYRPNIEPRGYVVFTDPAAQKGNYTKVPYGLHPGENRYYMPLTVRKLVNPDAPPDKQLQMIAIGLAHPRNTFEGWCDVTLSNNTTKRVKLGDQKMGNQTRVLRGQSIERCRVTNTSGRGTLSLRLYEDSQKIFENRIKAPQTTIIYRKK